MRRGVLWVPYCFEKDVKFFSPNSIVISKFIDFYKADHFILEAKQEGIISGKGTAQRGTLTYQKAMEAVFGQAIVYLRNVSSKVQLTLHTPKFPSPTPFGTDRATPHGTLAATVVYILPSATP
jgi:hypothetical protein